MIGHHALFLGELAAITISWGTPAGSPYLPDDVGV